MYFLILKLKEKTFIITTNDEAEVFRQSFNLLSEKCEELNRTIQETKDDIGASGAKQIETIKDTTITVVQDFLKEEREKTDKNLYDRVERLESVSWKALSYISLQ
jgi:predicted HicB family RNase H-like nuclease